MIVSLLGKVLSYVLSRLFPSFSVTQNRDLLSKPHPETLTNIFTKIINTLTERSRDGKTGTFSFGVWNRHEYVNRFAITLKHLKDMMAAHNKKNGSDFSIQLIGVTQIQKNPKGEILAQDENNIQAEKDASGRYKYIDQEVVINVYNEKEVSDPVDPATPDKPTHKHLPEFEKFISGTHPNNSTKIDALALGWGFYSESATALQLCRDHGVIAIAPQVKNVEDLGHKQSGMEKAKAINPQTEKPYFETVPSTEKKSDDLCL